jgi:mono/diheme cytochrome c family protein
MTRRSFALILTTVVLASATIGAGGWAVVTVDELPMRVETGRPLVLAFTVRQHGMTALSGLRASVEAASGGTIVTAPAAGGRKTGQYTAEISFPRAGDWVVTIHSGFADGRLTLLPLTVVAPNGQTSALALPDVGRHLFVAKGCVTCHQNDARSSNVSLGLAPLLIAEKYQDAFLARILANPSATLPPRTEFPQMPNLELRPAEISALVAFINSTGRAQTRY